MGAKWEWSAASVRLGTDGVVRFYASNQDWYRDQRQGASKTQSIHQEAKPAKDVLINVNGVLEVVIVDDGFFDILYDEALLEKAAIIAELEDAGYDAELMTCRC